VAFRVILPDQLEWVEREPEGDGASRHVARLSDVAGFQHTRGSMWRYPPNSKGRRHRDTIQEETFVILAGTLTMYLGDPPEKVEVLTGGVVHVESGTVLQSANHGDEEVLMYAYGAPPEAGGAEFLDSAV
jgi:mannose-6-phosphate isomerase-like protein (cupin superfamily)